MAKMRYCTRCGAVGVPEIVRERNYGPVFWVLLVLGVLPGLVYWAFGGGSV